MDDQRGDGAVARGFLVFVRPASVIGEGLTFEKFWVVGNGLADKQESDFAFQVVTLVIVPVFFGCVDAVTDEDDRSVEMLNGFGLRFVAGDVVVEIFQLDR